MNRRISIAPLAFVLFVLTPVWWLVAMSFKSNKEIFSGLTLWPAAPDLSNFRLILTDPDWYGGYINAAIYVAINVAVSVGVAIPAAYAFSRRRFFGQRALFFGLLSFRMMAPAILLTPFVQITSDLGLFDTHLAVALAHCFFNAPLAIWIFEGFISAVPRQVDESAFLDGHSLPQFFRRILLPMIAPGIAVTAFFCFMFSWVEYLLANGLTAVHAKPIAGIMTRAGGVLAADVALLAAASVLGLLPGLVLIVFVRNHLARGFSMGRVT